MGLSARKQGKRIKIINGDKIVMNASSKTIKGKKALSKHWLGISQKNGGILKKQIYGLVASS